MSDLKSGLFSIKYLLVVSFFSFPLVASAHLLSITATTPFPSTVTPLSTSTATYTISNTSTNVSVYAINQSVFPSTSGLSITSSTCGSLMAPGASCTMELSLTAALAAQTISGQLRFWAKPSADGVESCITVGNTATQYAYVADDSVGNSHVYRCSLNADGTYNSCNITPTTGAPAWRPTFVAFARVNGTQYAYVADSYASNLYRCTISSDGNLNACATTPSVVPALWTPYGVAFATVSGTQYGYVTAASPDNQLFQCTLNSNGTFNACTGVLGAGDPTAIAFATVSGTLYAYVTDSLGGLVYRYLINTNGSFGASTSTPVAPPAWTPIALAFATQNGTQYAYVADTASSLVYQCSLNASGLFTACTATPTIVPAWTPLGLAFATQLGTQAGYVADNGGNIYHCTLNASGNFNTCTATPTSGAPAWAPVAVAFASS